MKRAIITGYGGVDKLGFQETEIPAPGHSEILVKVVAAAYNPKDSFIRKGRFKWLSGSRFPIGVGFDFSGFVEKSNSAKYRAGDAVFGMLDGVRGKTFAEYLTVHEGAVGYAPANIDLSQAAAFPLAAQTALQALRDLGKITPGSKVCINGGSGGVGTFAIQIARILGAEITSLSSPSNFELCASLGAHSTMDYQNAQFFQSASKFDIFFDVFGNRSFFKIRHLMSKNGIYISTVPGREILVDQFFTTVFKTQKARLIVVRSTFEKLEWIKEQAEKGSLLPIIDSCFSFPDYIQGFTRLEQKRTKGKILMLMQDERMKQKACFA